MTIAEKHIRHYNKLNGQNISKRALSRFHKSIKKDIDSGRIDAKTAIGKKVLEVEERIYKALKQVNGYVLKAKIDFIEIPKEKKSFPLKKTTGSGAKKVVAEKKDPTPVKEATAGSKTAKAPKKSSKAPAPSASFSGLSGVSTADKAPELTNTFTLPGECGKFMGTQQRHQLVITITGEYGSSKSEFVNQLADAFVDAGFKTVIIDEEKGGLQSKDTQASIDRNVKPANKKKLIVASGLNDPKMQSLKDQSKNFDVVILDSGTKMGEMTNAWVDQLRKDHPDTIWVIIFQRNANKRLRGGAAAEFDAPVALETVRADWTDHSKNYVKINKNRGNRTDVWYMITQRKVVEQEPLTTEAK